MGLIPGHYNPTSMKPFIRKALSQKCLCQWNLKGTIGLSISNQENENGYKTYFR
jgi:hypothetical protein